MGYNGIYHGICNGIFTGIYNEKHDGIYNIMGFKKKGMLGYIMG
jgi:hypothetical protein